MPDDPADLNPEDAPVIPTNAAAIHDRFKQAARKALAKLTEDERAKLRGRVANANTLLKQYLAATDPTDRSRKLHALNAEKGAVALMLYAEGRERANTFARDIQDAVLDYVITVGLAAL